MKVSRGASLDRYYLLKLFGWGIFVHKIHHSDPVDLLHSHPWSGLSIMFGGYRERKLGGDWKYKQWFNWITATDYHQVDIKRPLWTIFIHGPKYNRWSVIDLKGKLVAIEPWEGEEGNKDYTQVKGDKNVV